MTAPTKKPQIPPRKKASSTPKPPVPKPSPPPPAYTRANLGLAKPKASEVEKTLTTGAFGEDKSERSYTTDAEGSVSGTQTETTKSTGAGVKASSKVESESFDGATAKQMSGEAETLVGAEAAIKILKVASADEIKIAVESLARAGAFGQAEMKAAIQRGKASASFGADASGGAGVQASMEAMAKIDRSGLIPALEATFEAAIKAGVWGEAGFKADARIGPLALAVCARIDGFLGASAEVSAKAFANFKEGIGGEISGEAFVGARSSGSTTAELTLGPAQLEVGAEYDAMAGAKAEVSLKASVSLKGVSAEFSASAFAGAKFEAKAHGAIKIMGKKIVHAKGKISVSAGAGGEVEGVFEIKSGKLRIGGELAATLGVGGGAGGELELDFGALAEVIVAKVGELAMESDNPAIKEKSPDYVRTPLTDPAMQDKKRQIGYESVYEDFLAYANKKTMQGAQGIKKERVQAIIQNRGPILRPEFAYVETDQGIENAAKEAFKGMLKGIVVQHGYIRAFDVVPATEVAAHKTSKQQEEKWRAARDAVRDDFTKYCLKKSGTGENGIKQENVQSIITKHWKQLQDAFPGAEADDVVKFAAQGMKDQYLTEFEVVGGTITKFVAPATKAAGVKQAVQQDADTAARAVAIQALGAKLTAFRTKLIAKPNTTVDKTELQKLITGATSKIKGQLAKPEVDTAINQQIMQSLDGIVESITITAGQVGALKEKAGGIDAARTQKASDSKQAAEQAAVGAFAAALEGYLDIKTGHGKNGLKAEQVQARFDRATSKVKEWASSGAADVPMQEAARAALGPMLTTIEIKNGKVTKFISDEAAMTAAKTDRKANGKKRLEGGEEDDNTRRRMVADAVRSEFASYAGKVRAASDKAANTAGGVSAVKLDKAKLQAIIDKRTKTVRPDVINAVGDEALVVAAKNAFGPMIKDIEVKGLQITKLEVENNFATIAKAKREGSAAVIQAQADLTAELKTSAQSVKPTLALVQAVINKHKGKFSGLPADEVDTALTMAVTNALRASIEEIEIVGAKVKKFSLLATPAKVH
jgi:hypothetical protein